MTFKKAKFMYIKVNDSRQDAIMGPFNTLDEYKGFLEKVTVGETPVAEPVFSMAPETAEEFLKYDDAKDGPWTSTPTETL